MNKLIVGLLASVSLMGLSPAFAAGESLGEGADDAGGLIKGGDIGTKIIIGVDLAAVAASAALAGLNAKTPGNTGTTGTTGTVGTTP